MSMRSLGIVLLLFALAGKLSSADTRKPQAQGRQLFAGKLIERSECVSIVAGMRQEKGLERHTVGKGKNKRTQFYFHGSEVSTFPAPLEIMIDLRSECNPGSLPPLPWPDFVKHLRFDFEWDLKPAGTQTVSTRKVEPLNQKFWESVWQEQSPAEKRFSFTLPADGIPVDAQLTVHIYVDDRQMKTFVLAL